MELLPDDWSSVFALQTPLLELIARGTALYFGILLMMRLLPRRMGAELATMDLVFLLLIAQAAAHSLGDYTGVADGLAVIATFMGWDYLVNLLGYYFPFLEKVVSAPSVQIVRDGRLLRRNLRREFVTQEELQEHLRREGVDDVRDVKAAYIEGEGHITVVKRRGA